MPPTSYASLSAVPVEDSDMEADMEGGGAREGDPRESGIV